MALSDLNSGDDAEASRSRSGRQAPLKNTGSSESKRDFISRLSRQRSGSGSSSSASPDTILLTRVTGLAITSPRGSPSSSTSTRSASDIHNGHTSTPDKSHEPGLTNMGPSSDAFDSHNGTGFRISALNRLASSSSKRLLRPKKNPLFLDEHRANVKREKTRRISSLTEALKTEVRRVLRVPSVDELLSKRMAVERLIASTQVKSFSDEENKVRHLRELLRRNQERRTASLRPSRRALKEQERLAYEEKLLKRRALGIAGRRPLPDALSSEEDEIVNQTLRKQGNIASMPGAGVTSHDVQKLLPGQWLNDEVVNFYMKLLEVRSNEAVLKRAEARKAKARLARGEYDDAQQGGLDGARLRDIASVSEAKKKWNGIWNIHVFNTFFFEKLSKSGYASVQKWTRRIDLFTKDRVLMPINIGQQHWVCAVINMRDCRIEYYDSMGYANTKALETLREYVASEYADKKKSAHGDLDMRGWRMYTSTRSPQQNNGSDCGVFATMVLEQLSRRHPLDGQLDDELSAEKIVQRSQDLAESQSNSIGNLGDDSDIEEEWNFSQTNIRYLRRRMVYEIATTRLLEA